MLYDNGSAERHAVFGEMFGNPGISGGSERLQEKNTAVVLDKEIRIA